MKTLKESMVANIQLGTIKINTRPVHHLYKDVRKQCLKEIVGLYHINNVDYPYRNTSRCPQEV